MKVFGVILIVIGGLWGLGELWSIWGLISRAADRVPPGGSAQASTAEGLIFMGLVLFYVLPGLVVAGLGALVANTRRRRRSTERRWRW